MERKLDIFYWIAQSRTILAESCESYCYFEPSIHIFWCSEVATVYKINAVDIWKIKKNYEKILNYFFGIVDARVLGLFLPSTHSGIPNNRVTALSHLLKFTGPEFLA